MLDLLIIQLFLDCFATIGNNRINMKKLFMQNADIFLEVSYCTVNVDNTTGTHCGTTEGLKTCA